jgi:hypothetical protein
MVAPACPAEEKESEMPARYRRILAGLAIAAALALASPAILEASPARTSAGSPSFWSAAWEWLVSLTAPGGAHAAGPPSGPGTGAGVTIDPDGHASSVRAIGEVRPAGGHEG